MHSLSSSSSKPNRIVSLHLFTDSTLMKHYVIVWKLFPRFQWMCIWFVMCLLFNRTVWIGYMTFDYVKINNILPIKFRFFRMNSMKFIHISSYDLWWGETYASYLATINECDHFFRLFFMNPLWPYYSDS